MKRKRWFIALFALAFLLLIASIPRLYQIEIADASDIADYPALEEAYIKLCSDYSLSEIVTEETIHVVTVKNLWGSWDRYILPCFVADTRAVPTAGNGSFSADMHVLSPWSEENLFTRMCPIKLTSNVLLTPGENTFVSEHFDAYPQGAVMDSNGIVIFEKVNCDKEPSTFVYYTLATKASAQERDQETEATFQWNYFLQMCGKQILFGAFSIDQPYIVNA